MDELKLERGGFLRKLGECELRESRVRAKAEAVVAELAKALARAEKAESLMAERVPQHRSTAERMVLQLEEALR